MNEQEAYKELAWRYRGFACDVWRIPPLGHLCGYVMIPRTHVAYYMTHEQLEDWLRVHGGITFAEYEDGPYERTQRRRRIGFDCAHGCDAMDPAYYTGDTGLAAHWRNGHLWTVEEVIVECEELVDQLREADVDD